MKKIPILPPLEDARRSLRLYRRVEKSPLLEAIGQFPRDLHPWLSLFISHAVWKGAYASRIGKVSVESWCRSVDWMPIKALIPPLFHFTASFKVFFTSSPNIYPARCRKRESNFLPVFSISGRPDSCLKMRHTIFLFFFFYLPFSHFLFPSRLRTKMATDASSYPPCSFSFCRGLNGMNEVWRALN